MRDENGKRRRSPDRIAERGELAIEAAFVLPVVLLLMIGIIKFGAALWQWHTMLLAVEQAGRYVMINNSTCDTSCAETQMQTVLPSAAVCTNPSTGQICVNATTDTSASPYTMTLTANYSFDFYGLAGPFTITSAGTVPLD
jgi:Flp pilus assembly protein TadG